ncbi:HAD-IA family hydrolase [Porphyrobacter algicida]|uniref:phosphoglycolate phosphatase n=1 Tax=Qipengyuania algicida TaxID=1836209 RepID=A0A845AJL5_9SPHN|nr:HAD-IA family hydrolase [Qipengyuania algicida]MXP28746.1 HAD-IA family hydrolase [Qipengyuania algicida]
MSDFPFAIVGFDLDGTVLDTHRDLGEAVNYALGIRGFDPVPDESMKDLIGGGAKLMLARAIEQQGGLPDDEFRSLYKQMLAYYGENCAVHTAPFPGMSEVLSDLYGRGIPLALVTNKFESFARKILTELQLIDCFSTLLGGDTLGKGTAKPAPDQLLTARERCGGGAMVYIGDSSYDVAAARAAEMPVVVAGYGYNDKPPHELGGDAVIDSPAELLKLLQDW